MDLSPAAAGVVAETSSSVLLVSDVRPASVS